MDVFVTLLLLRDPGPAALDRRTLRVTAGALLACLLVTGLHASLAPWGAWRLLLDAPAYLALAGLFGALPVRRLVALTGDVMRQRRTPAARVTPD